MKKKEGLRIYRFQAENIKRLGVVQITPKGNIIKISGANGSGKTSILDCIEYALFGTGNVPAQVIRRGKRSATIQLDIGKVVVTRKFIDSGRTTLQVMSKADRSLYQSPQALLDALAGHISFDPLDFIRMKPKDQFNVLRKLVDIDWETFDAEYKRDYEMRREVKKDYLAIEVRRDAIYVQPDLPLERRDEEALTKEMADVAQFNEALQQERGGRADEDAELEKMEREFEARKQTIENHQAEIKRLLDAQVATKNLASDLRAKIKRRKPLDDPKNARELAEQLNAARIVNAAITKREQRDALQAEIDALKERHMALSGSLAKIENAKAEAIAAVQFPVEGLSFGEEEVLWQGLPFNQVSNADQIRASVAIGMAMNPELRVMRVKDGSLLDSKSMAIVEELAKDENFQLWMEVVDESGKVGIYLEEGEVKAVNDDNEVPDEPERDMRIDLPMPGEEEISPEQYDAPAVMPRTAPARRKPRKAKDDQ